jgi:hypothetical protein
MSWHWPRGPQRYARSTVEHYQFADVGFADIEGYEYYAGLAQNIEKHGLEKFNGFLADLQVWGTPDQVTAKLLDYVERTDAGAVLATLSYGGMPYDEAYANFDLYASDVLPVLQALNVGGDIGVTYRPGQERLNVTADSGTNGDGVPVRLLP